MGNSEWETAFFKYWKLKITSKVWLLQLHVGYQIKELIIIFNLMGLAVKLIGVCHEIFFKNMILAQNLYFKSVKNRYLCHLFSPTKKQGFKTVIW